MTGPSSIERFSSRVTDYMRNRPAERVRSIFGTRGYSVSSWECAPLESRQADHPFSVELARLFDACRPSHDRVELNYQSKLYLGRLN